MAIVTKDLGSIAVRTGTLNVMLYYDDTMVSSSSHIPTAVASFVNIGEVLDRLERKSGIFEIGDMTVQIRDDYSNYVAGVWYKLLHGSELQIRFYLDEGAGDTFLFWGYLDNVATQVTEVFVGAEGASGRYVRGHKVKLLSLMKKITSASIASLMSTIQSANPEYYTGGAHYLSIRRLFSSFIQNALGATYFDQDSSIVINSSNNLQYAYRTGTLPTYTYNFVGLDKLFMCLDSSGNFNFYTDTDSSYPNWTGRYSTAGELLKALSLEFGVVPRYFWDIANSRHCFELQERGRNGSFVTFPSGMLKSSSIQPVSEMKAADVKTIRVNDTAYVSSRSPQKTNHEIEIQVNFIAGLITGDHSTGVDWYEQLVIFNSGTLYDIYKAKYWDVSTGSMTDTGLIAGSVNHTMDAVRKLYDGMFITRTKKVIRRVYRGIKGSVDGGATYKHTVLVPGCRTQIHDGIASANYYANEVKKSMNRNEATIDWIGE